MTQLRNTLPDGVSETAIWIAMVRAEENARTDRLFADPFATAFLSSAGAVGSMPTRFDADSAARGAWLAGGYFVRVRTRFFDESVLAASASGIRQFVLLASGLDSRAFRLDWPAGTQLFEVDLPTLFDFKEIALAEIAAPARCARTTVGVDLRMDWPAAVTEAGFDPAAPTLWLAEGLVNYLSGDERDRLLRMITENSAPGSQLLLDCVTKLDAAEAGVRAATGAVRDVSSSAQDVPEDLVDLLGALGWSATVSRTTGVGQRWGQRPPEGADPAILDPHVLVTATKG